jgi:hypothetical protein
LEHTFLCRTPALNAELLRLGILRSPWLPGRSLPAGSTEEVSWIQAMVVVAGSKARSKSLEALLDLDYMLSNRPLGFQEKSWFALRPLPRSAFASIFGVLQSSGVSIMAVSIGPQVRH